jgi:hypothetical protein
MRQSVTIGLAVGIGSVTTYYAVQLGGRWVNTQLTDPLLGGPLWPVSVITAAVAVLLGNGIALAMSVATFEELGVDGTSGKGSVSLHGAGDCAVRLLELLSQ